MNNFTPGHSLSAISQNSSPEEGEQRLNEAFSAEPDPDCAFVIEELNKLNFSPRRKSLLKILQYSALQKELMQQSH